MVPRRGQSQAEDGPKRKLQDREDKSLNGLEQTGTTHGCLSPVWVMRGARC